MSKIAEAWKELKKLQLDLEKILNSQIDDEEDDFLYSGEGYYCLECESLCEMYEQGLSCRCDSPWETEILDKNDYPSNWIKVKIKAKKL